MVKKTLLMTQRLTLVLFSGFILFLLADQFAPLTSVLETEDKFALVIVAEDGTPLRAFADKEGVWRYPVSMSDVSPRYINTLVAYEDRWFWYHPGINPLAMIRAIYQNTINGRVISGGSTLTMQVARILDPHSRTFAGKLKQMFRALQLEWHYSKAEILTMYLNLAPFGGPLEGVQAASYAYLSKPAIELSQAEAALLSVLPQSPSRFRPDRYPERATRARNKVLERMHQFGYLSREQVDDAMLEIVVPQLEAMPMSASILARRLKSQVKKGEVLRTTIDAQLQLQLETLVKDYAHQLPDKSSAAVLVVNHHNMAVKAYVASADFYDTKRYGQVDMIQAVRSPGSTLKPFLYAMALDQGLITSHSMLMDEAVNINGYTPENFNQSFSGVVSMSEALQRSLNIPAIQVLQFLGPGYFHSQLENAGLKLHMPMASKPNLSIILGGAGVQLEQLVSAYTAFSRGGKAGKLRFYYDSVTAGDFIREKHLMSSGAAWIIRNILSQIQYRDPLSSMINNGSSLAWKTGTSYGFRDAWAIGMTDDYTIGIWTGRPDGTSVPGHYGAQTAVPLLRMVALNLPAETNRNQSISLEQPESVSQEVICWPDGRLKRLNNSSTSCNKTQLSWILDETVPPALHANPDIETALNELRIVSIEDGAQIKRPEGTHGPISINLQVKGSLGATYWFVNGKPINSKPTAKMLSHTFKQPGQYNVSAVDEFGQSDQVVLWVKP